MTQINLTATPIDNTLYVVECSECGPVGTEEIEGVNGFAYRHLEDAHNAGNIEWKIGDEPWPDEDDDE